MLYVLNALMRYKRAVRLGDYRGISIEYRWYVDEIDKRMQAQSRAFPLLYFRSSSMSY